MNSLVAAAWAGCLSGADAGAGAAAACLAYVRVRDLDASVDEALARGGELALPPRDLAGGRLAVVRDAAGGMCGLFQPPSR